MKIFYYNNNLLIFSKIEIIINNIFVFLLILFPFALISGPLVPDLIIVLSTIYFIYLAFKKENILKYFNAFIIKFLIFFWIYLIISSLTSDDIFFSLRSSLFYLRFIIFSCFIWFILDSYPNFKKYFLMSIIFAFLFVEVDSIYQYFNNSDIFGHNKPNLRLTGPFKDRQIVGSYLSRLLPLLLFIFLLVKKNIHVKLNLFICFTAIVVFLSGERTSSFMITFFIFFYFFINYNFYNFIKYLFLYISIIFLLLQTQSDLNERFIKQTLQGFGIKKYTKTESENIYFKEKPSKGFYFFSKAHEVHYETAIKMFLDNKILGVGPNMFRKKCSDKKFYIEKSSCTTHPHNTLIQLLGETGIIGILFFLILFFNLIYNILIILYKNKIKFLKITEKEKNIFLLNIGFIINVFLIFVPSGNFFNNYLNATIFLPLGFYMYYINNNE